MLKKSFFILLGVLVFTAVFAVFRPSLIVPKSVVRKEMELPNSKYFDWKGNKIHYVDEGQGETILMIHGFGGSHQNFQKITEKLKDHYRVIRVDLPGFGLSDFPKEKQNYATMYSSFIADFTTALGLDSIYVMGNSMGGGVSWVYTLDHPKQVKGLVLLDAFGYDAKSIQKHVLRATRFSVFHLALKKGLPLFLSRRAAQRCFENDDLISEKALTRTNRIWNAEGNIDALFALASFSEFPSDENIKKIQVPTLIIWGKQDNLIPAEHAARFHHDIKNSAVVVVDHCGHVPMMEQPEKVERAFSDWEKTL